MMVVVLAMSHGHGAPDEPLIVVRERRRGDDPVGGGERPEHGDVHVEAVDRAANFLEVSASKRFVCVGAWSRVGGPHAPCGHRTGCSLVSVVLF